MEITLLLLLLVVYIAIFYFLKMRPEKKRKKEQEEMKKALAPGDSVTMIDGIETGADRVRLEYAHWAIMEKGVSVDQVQK